MKPLSPAIARLFDRLVEAEGAFVPGQEIAALLGIPMFSIGNFIRALRDARPELTIEGKKGHGYRLTIDGHAEAAEQAQLRSTDADIDGLFEKLMATPNEFVSGGDLAAAGRIHWRQLHEAMRDLRAARPTMRFETRRGGQYRVLMGADGAAPTEQRKFDPPRKPVVVPAQRMYGGNVKAGHDNWATGVAMLDLLPPRLAEIVKGLALDSEQSAQEAIVRLLSYGVEVHHDLVATGQHPLTLRSVRP